MKKLIVLSVIIAVMFLTRGSVAPAHAQDSAKDDKPTFYHLVPGTYVNPWPRFTVTYPKEWTAERPTLSSGRGLSQYRLRDPARIRHWVSRSLHFLTPWTGSPRPSCAVFKAMGTRT